MVGDLALCVEFGAQFVASVSDIDEEGLACFVGVFAEEVAQEVIHDERRGVQVYVYPEVVVVSQFVRGEGQGGIEGAQQAVYGVHGYFPNAEEAQDVVYAVCIEVFGHFAEACFPPCKSVTVHFFPVVGGESPVLTQNGEVVRRRTGLAVHIEQACIGPCVHACARYADRNVALDGHAFAVCIVAYGFQLFVKVVLSEVYNICLIGSFFGQFFDQFFGVFGVFAPLREVGSTEAVA